jgi:hypothetical protein
LRSALKRVGAKAKPASAADPVKAQLSAADPVKAQLSAADPVKAQRRRGQRSAQAALGMMDRPPAAQDDAALKEWLDQLPQPQKEKLARLVGQARAGSSPERPSQPGLARVERQLAGQGINFDINANTVIVNIGGNGREDRSREGWRGRPSQSRNDWGRQWGRVKDFINGH